MNWKKPVFMLGAVLLCTSLLMANTPPAQLTAAGEQVKPVASAKASPAQLTALDIAPQRQLKPMPALHTTSAAAPQNLVRGMTCPEDSLYGQNPHQPEDTWSIATSADATAFTYIVYDNYVGVSGEICDIHWWGLSLHYDLGWYACDPTGVTFNIGFYPDNGGLPGDAVCTYTGVTPTVTGTGLFYSGFEMYYFEILSLDPCCMLTDGWVSIQSQMNDNDCAFLWASGPAQYDGDSLQDLNDGMGPLPTGYDRAFCLTGEYIPLYGACCDDYTGVCEDNVEYLDCDGRFAADTLCCDLQPPCGPTGACCSMDLVCLATNLESACDEMGGSWYEGEDCDAGFECPAYCDHSIELWDDYGDGWNSCTLDVSVNGELVLDNITLASGYGPGIFTFQAATGDTITTAFTPVSWPEECSYYIYDVNGVALCSDGLGGTVPAGVTCTGNCGPPPRGACCDDYTGVCEDDVAIQDCDARFAQDTLCADLDPPCGILGACCIDYVCVDTTYEADCAGSWYEGMECPGFECPETDADFIVTAPFTSDLLTTCGAGYDCALVADSPDHEYEVIIPHAGEWNFNTCLYSGLDTMIFVGTTLCSQDIGYNDDSCGLQSEVIAYLEPGNYFCTIEHYCCDTCGEYIFDVHEVIPPAGACCVDLVCEETNTQLECDTLGGLWYEGQTCPEFECPIPGECDFCEDPCIVTGPYPVTVPGTCVGMTIDCPGVLDWTAMWYEVELPFGVNDLSVSYCPTTTDLATVGIVRYDACGDCPAYIIADLYAFTYGTCPGGYTGCDMEWNGVPGPGTTLVPAYLIDAASNPLSFNATFNVINAGAGACCVGDDPPVCYDTEEPECDDMGGTFYIGEQCATFDCPVPCEESQIDIAILTDPYPSETTWVITNHIGGEVICSGGPYAESYTTYYEMCCIPYDGCVDFTMYDSYGDGIYAPGGFTVALDGVELVNTMGGGFTGSIFTYNNFGGGCVPDTGACCDADLNCVATNTEDECDALGGDWFIFEDCDAGYECLAHCYDCPSNGMLEGEPVCEDDYVDNYNGGCNSSPYVFQDILCDEVICGESGTFLMGGSSYRDTDWFRVTVAEATTLGWSVCAEFDLLIFVIDAGSGNCLDYTILGSATAPPEVTATLSFAVGPGDYWLWAGPSVFTGVPCGSQYTGIVTGVAPCICGDFDNDDDVDVDDFYFFLDAFGSCEGDEKYEEACDFDGDLCITLVDFQMWMECYRDANGKAFVAPLQRTNSRPAGQKAPKGAQPR